MKTKNYLYAILALLSVSFFAQETSKTGTLERTEHLNILHVNGEHRKSLRLLDFLRKDSRFSSSSLTSLANYQMNTNASTYEKNNTRPTINTSQIAVVYYDGELILGDGVNRLFSIDHIRMEEIKTISKSVSKPDRPIYITSMK